MTPNSEDICEYGEPPKQVVEWNEPFGEGKYGYTCRASIEDVVAFMVTEYQQKFKSHPNYPYPSDKDALDDFLVIHCGCLVDAD